MRRRQREERKESDSFIVLLLTTISISLLSGGFNLSSETMRGGCQSSTDQVISCHQHTKHGCEPAAPLRTESHPHSLCNAMFEEAARSSSPAAFVRTPSSRGDLTSCSPSGRSGLRCFCLPTILRSPLRHRPHLHILSSLLASHCPLFTSLWDVFGIIIITGRRRI